jgi:hypothetical protein
MPKEALLDSPSRRMFAVKRPPDACGPPERCGGWPDEPLHRLADKAVTNSCRTLLLNKFAELIRVDENDVLTTPKKLRGVLFLAAVIAIFPYGTGAAH